MIQPQTNEDTSVTVNVLANDTDNDGDTLTISAFDATSVNGGTITDNGGGILQYTSNINFNGTDTFTYTVSDGYGGNDIATVTITVNAVNDAPNAGNDSGATDEDTTVTINVLTNDSDPEGY